MTDTLLQISIIIGIIGNIIGVSIGAFVVARYFLVIDKRLKKLEEEIKKNNSKVIY
jgi:uncharacterized membrane protein YciS (DUF1049 family)